MLIVFYGFLFPLGLMLYKIIHKKPSLTHWWIYFHSGLHTFLGSFINYSGSTIVVQSNGSISLPVYSFSATRTPKLSAAVVRYTPLRESPKLMTLALTISLGLKH